MEACENLARFFENNPQFGINLCIDNSQFIYRGGFRYGFLLHLKTQVIDYEIKNGAEVNPTMSDREVLYYDFDDFRLDAKRHRLLKNGEPVSLAPKVFQTLHILVRHSGRLVAKEDLYQQIWAGSFVEESNLTQYIYLLRKIVDKDKGESLIETVTRRGYIFTAPVEKIFAAAPVGDSVFERTALEGSDALPRANEADKNQAAAPQLLPLLPGPRNGKNKIIFEKRPADPGLPGEASKKTRQYSRAVPLLFVGVLLAVIVAAGFSSGILSVQIGKRSLIDNAAPAPASIAILPLQPVGEKCRESKCGLGIADAIITRLARLPRIPLRLTNVIFPYTDAPASSAISAGRELGVDTVLEGTVEQDGERVKVFARLISVSEGKPLWEESFDEKLTDILELQDSISSRIVQILGLELTTDQLKLLGQRSTNKPEAFEAYQLGLYFWNTRSKEGLQQAAVHFQSALEIDPKFARAYAFLADTYYMLGFHRFSDRDEMYDKAFFIAAESLSIDDSVAEGHIVLALIHAHRKNDDAARHSFERALELAPYSSTARVKYAWLLLRDGKTAEAIGQIRSAREYDPLSPVSNGAECSMSIFQENFVETIKVCQKVVELFPNTLNNRLVLANAYFFNGDAEEAISQAKIGLETGGNKYSTLGSLGYFYAKLGRLPEAEAIVTQLKLQVEKNDGLLNDMALITYALGRKNESFSYLKKAWEKKVVTAIFFRNDPVWKDLRENPRFNELIKGHD